MRFVPRKSAEQQAALALHRTRDLLVRQRTQLVNMLRGLLAEFGIEMVRGLHHALRLAGQLSKGEAPEAPPLARLMVKERPIRSALFSSNSASLEKKLLAWHRSNIFFASDDPPSRAASANDTTASTVSCGQSVFCRAAYGQAVTPVTPRSACVRSSGRGSRGRSISSPTPCVLC